MVWLLFLVRGAFYCTMLPVWEGFDEYAHFARFSQSALPSMNTPMTREVERTFSLLPLPDQLAWIPGAKIHPNWWKEDHTAQLREAHSIPASEAREPSKQSYQSYESQQGPLYYWLLWPLMQLASGWNILDRVLLARLVSLFIASAAIPLVRLAGGSRVGLGAACFLAVSPMFAVNVSRAANDCLAIALIALLLVLLRERGRNAWYTGIVLGLTLLTKAYALTLLPALFLLLRGQRAKVLGTGFAIGGWWYVRNILLTGRLTGWEDDAPLSAVLESLPSIPWLRATGTIFKTALWFGGWSFLTARAWMYNLLLVILALCIAAGWKGATRWKASWLIVVFFLAGMVYDVGAEFVTQHATGTPGWYLWGVGAAFAILIAGGAGRWIAPVCALLCAFDLYTSQFVMLPYYAGFAAHGRSFASLSQWPEAIARLGVPWPLWIAFLTAGPAVVGTLIANYEVTSAAAASRLDLTAHAHPAPRPTGE